MIFFEIKTARLQARAFLGDQGFAIAVPLENILLANDHTAGVTPLPSSGRNIEDAMPSQIRFLLGMRTGTAGLAILGNRAGRPLRRGHSSTRPTRP